MLKTNYVVYFYCNNIENDKELQIRRICRKDHTENVEKIVNKQPTIMRCISINNKHPYLKLGPFNFDIQNNDPIRLVIHNFLSEQEISLIRKRYLKYLTFERSAPVLAYVSTAVSYGSQKASTFRFNDLFYNTSNIRNTDTTVNIFAELTRTRKNMMYNIAKRMELSTRINVIEYGSAYPYRLQLNGLGSLIESHMDFYSVLNKSKTLHKEFEYKRKYGDNMASMLIWLNDIEGGGGTYFSSIGRSQVITPVKGAALFWINLKSSGYGCPYSEHGGCPVSRGMKLVLGQWINHYNQWQNFPCRTKADLKINLSLGGTSSI